MQQVPFAFRSAPHAHEAMDGALGAYIRDGDGGQGDPRLCGRRVRQRHAADRPATTAPIVAPADLKGMRMRVPAGQMFDDTFRTLGAEPVTINSIDIYDALKSGKVDAQENPLALVDSFKLYEVVKYVSMTNHMWSGFNQLAHLPTWQRLPADIQTVIERNVTRVRAPAARRIRRRANGRLRAELTKRGLIVQRRRSGAVPARVVRLLRQLEGAARDEVLGTVGKGGGHDAYVSQAESKKWKVQSRK